MISAAVNFSRFSIGASRNESSPAPKDAPRGLGVNPADMERAINSDFAPPPKIALSKNILTTPLIKNYFSQLMAECKKLKQGGQHGVLRNEPAVEDLPIYFKEKVEKAILEYAVYVKVKTADQTISDELKQRYVENYKQLTDSLVKEVFGKDKEKGNKIMTDIQGEKLDKAYESHQETIGKLQDYFLMMGSCTAQSCISDKTLKVNICIQTYISNTAMRAIPINRSTYYLITQAIENIKTITHLDVPNDLDK